ncbi:(2Fe-2S) ferredoxin [Roseibium aquae]|uniref:(2Fe-2S) ferredoxin n=1 Tax=Roseibium aquae TaxID=1323746 RepID=A0A916TLR6_9HYPH|nr:DUF1284 domain-containing protein [Roseibium aquae]GGB54526.1 (2Fe-2S) ferredoxin [Roseibium aquae]
MPIRLRAHHLLCILTFKGEGYSHGFVANYQKIVDRLNGGEPVILVEGPDDICAPLACEKDAHCFNASVRERDIAALRWVEDRVAIPHQPGAAFHLAPGTIAKLRHSFANETHRAPCLGCDWYDLCSHVAADDYEQALLKPRSAQMKRT